MSLAAAPRRTGAAPRAFHAVVVSFPGSNSETELVRTLRDVSGLRTSLVGHLESVLPADTDLVALPGGFSFGDYLRPGALGRTSPIADALREHAARGGLVLGICNGFQLLTELGLLPGALLPNASLRFESRDVFVRAEVAGPFTSRAGAVFRLPIAHGAGRYHADRATLAALEAENRIAFRYAHADGRSDAAANPNGSALEIAGIYGGPARNVLGMMPHPERRSEPLHGGLDGKSLFDAMLQAHTATAPEDRAALFSDPELR